MDARYRTRPAAPADAEALARLERRCFSDPWSTASFREALRSEWTVALVAEDAGGSVAGYLIGREIAGTAEILNVAVRPEDRRRGLGRTLLLAGLEALAERGAGEVFLEVRESNHSAQALYREQGFEVVGHRARYYRRPEEGALVFRRARE